MIKVVAQYTDEQNNKIIIIIIYYNNNKCPFTISLLYWSSLHYKTFIHLSSITLRT